MDLPIIIAIAVALIFGVVAAYSTKNKKTNK